MRFIASFFFIVVIAAGPPVAAQEYQLVEPSGVITADVYFSSGQMTINDANGRQYLLNRDRSLDSYNGQYSGYLLPPVNRVVRFPRSGTGLMQIADLDDAFPRYVNSRRSVRRVAGRPRRPGRPGGPRIPSRPGHFHGHPGHGHGFAYIPPYFRSPYGYPVFGYGYGYPGFGIGYPRFGYGYQSFGTTLSVGPLAAGGLYRPRPYYRPLMQSIVLDSQIIPREPLPPVTLNLLNSAQREIRVTVTDRVAPNQSKRLRIAPGTASPLVVERDTGADRVRRVRTYAPDGSQITREISAPIFPVARYELVVHEWRLQSVAIDRTGKSPNVIEDSQFQGRGIGRFQLPPGDQITAGTIDVVRAALSAQNAGSVTPILDDTNSQGPLRPVSSLEQMLLQQRKASGR